LTLLSEIEDAVPYFFGKDVVIEPEAREEILTKEYSKEVLNYVLSVIDTWHFNEEEKLHEELADLRTLFKEKGLKPKETMWALRVAVTGRTKGADMCGILVILGKDVTKHRIKAAL